MDVACDFADLTPNGTDADAFALDVGTGTRAVSVDGSNRPALTVAAGGMNGNPPLVSARLVCQFGVTDASNAVVQVRTKAAFALDASTPSGTVSRGMRTVAAYRFTASSCDTANLKKVSVKLAMTDRASNGWIDQVKTQISTRVRIAVSTATGVWMGTPSTGGSTATSLTVNVDLSAAPLASPATFVVMLDSSNASAFDTVQALPQELVSWTGTQDPASYPAQIKAPDFAAAAGNVLTFQ